MGRKSQLDQWARRSGRPASCTFVQHAAKVRISAERIRDKIAASMKKGQWMGATVPLGKL
jgi:hypothetical protein